MKKNIYLILVFLLISSNLFSQENYLKYELDDTVSNISNYNYRIYTTSEKAIYYIKQLTLESKDKPLVMVSPLGTEALMLANGDVGIFNTLSFDFELKKPNKLKNDKIVEIIADENGSAYYLISERGKLYKTRVKKKSIVFDLLNLDYFVSKAIWSNNLNQLLIADDYYLQYYNPLKNISSNKIKLESDITSLNVDDKNFEVHVGLSNGNLIILNQDLTVIKKQIKISDASISSIQSDPLDHYLYIGDDSGKLNTYDKLKNKIIQSKELHSGSVFIKGIYDRHINKKFLLTVGNDLFLKVLDITDLEPNYSRVINEKIVLLKEAFLKIRDGESAVKYDDRVNVQNLSNYLESYRSSITDSIAEIKSSKTPLFEINNDSLSVFMSPFPKIKIRLFKNSLDISQIKLKNIHFNLEEDNTFSIKNLVLINSDDTEINYSSDKKTMQFYEDSILLEIAKEIANKEAAFKKSLSDIVANLRSNGKLNDVELSVQSVLKKEKDSLGNDELNLHVTFLSQGVKAEIEKETADYPAGKYDIFDSEAATTLVGFFIKSTAEKLQEYLINGARITFKITGATDQSKISKSLPYNNEYGAFKNFPFYFQSSLAGLNLNQQEGIKDNSQLGFLRTYSVRNFIENNTEVFEGTIKKYIHYSEESENYGPEYRKIKIEMIIHNVNKLPSLSEKSNDIPLSDVDISIPSGKKVEGYALVIGNEDYSSFQKDLKSESNVPYAIRDAEVFKNYLTTLYNFNPDNIDFIKNSTYGEMSQSISRMERLMELDGMDKEIVIYYSGHGMPDETTKEPFLIPVDINGSNVDQGISLKDLMTRLSKKPHKKITLVIDACFSGLGKKESLTTLKGIRITPVNPELGDNMVFLSSSSGNESSAVDDENQHGLFTYFLLKKLKETKGEITLGDLYNNLKKDVGISAIKKLNKIQTPSILVGKNLKGKIEEVKFLGN